jgi:hypothetical protein
MNLLKFRRLSWCAALPLACGLAACAPAPAPLPSLAPPGAGALQPDSSGKLEGRYSFEGKLRDVDATTTRAELDSRKSIYEVTWSKNGTKVTEGMALRFGNLVAVAQGKVPRDFWNDYENLGIAVYKIDGADLRGMRIFLEDYGAAPQPQILRPIAGAPDRYSVQLLSGEFVPGQEIKITPNGDAYLFVLYTPGVTMIGTGVKLGEHLVFGLSSTTLPSITAFCRDGDALRGIGVRSSGKQIERYQMHPVGGPSLPDDLPEGDCASLLAASR